MAREAELLSRKPTALAYARPQIEHPQLRDLVICPLRAGLLNYVSKKAILEHDIHDPTSSPRTLTSLNFTPNTLASYAFPDDEQYLIVAGGQDCQLSLSLHATSPSSPSPSGSSIPVAAHPPARTRTIWKNTLRHGVSINNSVFFAPRATSLALGAPPDSAVEPRLIVNNNDCTVTFHDVSMRASKVRKRLQSCGRVHLGVPVNHSSISPDGRTLLSVGDFADVVLHALRPGARPSPTHIATLRIPPLVGRSTLTDGGAPASFATAFSASGAHFAVGTQNGTVVVWDVRSSRPLKVVRTADSLRQWPPRGDNSGWLFDPDDRFLVHSGASPWGVRSGAPPWGVRTIKFGGTPGSEVLAFSEHTDRMHVMDARTFEAAQIVEMPLPPPPPVYSPASSPPAVVIPPHPAQEHFDSVAQEQYPPHQRRPHAVIGDVWMDDDEETGDDASAMPVYDDLDDGVANSSHELPPSLQRAASRYSVQPSEAEAFGFDSPFAPGAGISADDVMTSWRGYLEQGPAPSRDEDMTGRLAMLARELVQAPRPPRAGAPAARSLADTWLGVARPYLSTGAPDAVMRAALLPTPPVAESLQTSLASPAAAPVHLAGMCFDPLKQRLYLASEGAVAEWGVRGAALRWWAAYDWA